VHRFEFTFTPTHGSWLNLVEGFFSKLARSVLRRIRVASKQDLKDRIMAAMDYFGQQPVVHIRSFSSIRLLDMIRISETLIKVFRTYGKFTTQMRSEMCGWR
jgi:DDE superfamily endonuclease